MPAGAARAHGESFGDANGWADVLRLVAQFDGLAGYPVCRDYVARATARPSFMKAHVDQIAHFAAAE